MRSGQAPMQVAQRRQRLILKKGRALFVFFDGAEGAFLSAALTGGAALHEGVREGIVPGPGVHRHALGHVLHGLDGL